MRPYTEAPPQDPSTDGDRPLLQRVFGHAESDRHDDPNHIGDTVEGRTADPTQPEDQRYAGEQTADQPSADHQRRDAAAPRDEPRDAVADDEPHGERRMDELSGIHRNDDTGTTHDDDPAAIDEPAQHDPALGEPADDEPAADPRAGEPASRDEPTDLKPGDAPVAVVTAVWAEGSAQDLRNRWREAQLRFVDDPRKAANDTRNLVNEAVEALTAALASHREQLNSLPTNGDTEQYRVVVQRCRTFFERLLTL
jgi:hypothetical protein